MVGIAVVIPVFNQAYALSLTLYGFTQQTLDPGKYQIIIVDDGSDEPVEAIVKAYEKQLSVNYIRINRSGRAAARNKGVQQLKDGHIIFCDADRIPRPDYIQAYTDFLRRHPQSIVIGQVREMYISNMEKNRQKIIESIQSDTGNRIPQYCKLIYQLFSADGESCSSVLWISTFSGNMAIPVSVFRELGGFDGNFKQWGFEHFEFGYRAQLRKTPFKYNKGAVNIHLAHSRGDASYVKYIKASHAYFYKKHPSFVVEKFLEFMLGRISIHHLQQAAQYDRINDQVEHDRSQYVAITNF